MKGMRWLSIFFLLSALPVSAATEAQQQSIKQLGGFMGVALQCRFSKKITEIKRALITSLPKQRVLGELFDTETHNAYLNFIKLAKPCPQEEALSVQIEKAIIQLQISFTDDK